MSETTQEIQERHERQDKEIGHYLYQYWGTSMPEQIKAKAHKDRGILLKRLQAAKEISESVDQFLITKPSEDQMLIWQENFRAIIEGKS